jgi:hypothetical protein
MFKKGKISLIRQNLVVQNGAKQYYLEPHMLGLSVWLSLRISSLTTRQTHIYLGSALS